MNLLEGAPVGENTLIVTIDVESLYISLGQRDILATTKKALDNKSEFRTKQKQFLVDALE